VEERRLFLFIALDVPEGNNTKKYIYRRGLTAKGRSVIIDAKRRRR
jgi:hypothetical protein